MLSATKSKTKILCLVLFSIGVFGCQTKEDVQPSPVPTEQSRNVDASFYQFLSGKWSYCQNPRTWIAFNHDTLIVRFDGLLPDTSKYILTLESKSNWVKAWRISDSAYTWMQIEWRQDNTLFIGGGQYCRP